MLERELLTAPPERSAEIAANIESCKSLLVMLEETRPSAPLH
jgi:hypothetical protein